MPMFPLVFRTTPARVAWFFQQIEYYGVCVIELVTALAVLLGVLSVLFMFLVKPILMDWLLVCLWALAPSIRFLPHPPSAALFWGTSGSLLVLVVLSGIALYLTRDGITRMIAWARDPNGQALKHLRRERARLAYLLVKAQEENEQVYYWKHGAFPADASLETLAISKYAGPWSFYYVTLSTYLRLPVEPSEHRHAEETSTIRPDGMQDDDDPVLPRATEQGHPPYGLFLLGGVRPVLHGSALFEVIIKSFRARELLAFLAVPAREKECVRDDIVFAIHEEHTIRESDEGDSTDYQKKAREAFAYDVRVLGQLLHDGCQKAGVPSVDPVTADRGSGAFHRLADAYQVVDISRLERLAERIRRMKEGPMPPPDLEVFRAEYTATLRLYGEGFLGRQMRKHAAPWYKPYYIRYQDLFHGLQWNLAEYEYALSRAQQGEERKASLRHAATLYQECAFLTAPSSEDLEHGTSTPLSDHALRQCVVAYGLLGDHASAHHCYYRYATLLKRRWKTWRPDPQTLQAFEKATQVAEEMELR